MPVAVVLAPVLALPVSGVVGVAHVALDGDVPHVGVWLREARRRAGRKLLVATVQLLLSGLGALNLLASGGIGGLLGAITTMGVVYGLVVLWAVATALWPILADPRRDGPLRDQLRLALAVALSRPLGVLLLLGLVAGSVVASVQFFLPGLVLPSIVLLAAAAYVDQAVTAILPSADEDVGGGPATG